MPKIPKARQAGAISTRVGSVGGSTNAGALAESSAQGGVGDVLAGIGNKLTEQWAREDAQDFKTDATIALNKGITEKKLDLNKRLNSGDPNVRISSVQYKKELNDYSYDLAKQLDTEAPNNIGKRDFSLKARGILEQEDLNSTIFVEQVKTSNFRRKSVEQGNEITAGTQDWGKMREGLKLVTDKITLTGRMEPDKKEELISAIMGDAADKYISTALRSNDLPTLRQAKKDLLHDDAMRTALTEKEKLAWDTRIDRALTATQGDSDRRLIQRGLNYGSSTQLINKEDPKAVLQSKQQGVELLADLNLKIEDGKNAGSNTLAYENAREAVTIANNLRTFDEEVKSVKNFSDLTNLSSEVRTGADITASQRLGEQNHKKKMIDDLKTARAKNPGKLLEMIGSDAQEGSQAYLEAQKPFGVGNRRLLKNESVDAWADKMNNTPDGVSVISELTASYEKPAEVAYEIAARKKGARIQRFSLATQVTNPTTQQLMLSASDPKILNHPLREEIKLAVSEKNTELSQAWVRNPGLRAEFEAVVVDRILAKHDVLEGRDEGTFEFLSKSKKDKDELVDETIAELGGEFKVASSLPGGAERARYQSSIILPKNYRKDSDIASAEATMNYLLDPKNREAFFEITGIDQAALVAMGYVEKGKTPTIEQFYNDTASDYSFRANQNNTGIVVMHRGTGGNEQPLKRMSSKTAAGRVIINNADGSFSTELTATVEAGGKFYNVPTLFKGKQVSEKEATKILEKNNFVDPETGRKLKAFTDVDSAVASAEARSEKLGRRGRPSENVTISWDEMTKGSPRIQQAILRQQKLSAKRINQTIQRSQVRGQRRLDVR